MAKVTNSISLSGSGGSSIIVVANYSALPDPTTVSGLFYWVSNSQGTKWLPGSLGGTYYNSGLYYSNGTTWEFMNVPYQAIQAVVDAGTNNDQFLTPKTFNDSAQLGLKQNFPINSFSSTIIFDVPKVYNSFSSPTASNITDNLTGAKIGIVQKIYSNKATEPTYPAGWVKLSGTYTNSVTNIIYAEWCEGSRVEYWIIKG